jgi:hypothetical protein
LVYTFILYYYTQRDGKRQRIYICILLFLCGGCQPLQRLAYRLNDREVMVSRNCKSHMNLGQIIFHTDCWQGSTPRDAHDALVIDFITARR